MVFRNVKRLCEERKITIAELERTLGFGNGTIGRWATSSPSIDRVAKVASYFGMTVDELIREEDSDVNVL